MRIFVFVTTFTDDLVLFFNVAKTSGVRSFSFALVKPSMTSIISTFHSTSNSKFNFRHAKRSTVTAEDVKLVARRSTALVSYFNCTVRKLSVMYAMFSNLSQQVKIKHVVMPSQCRLLKSISS